MTRSFDFDFTPLFRSTVGFDHMMQLLNAAMTTDNTSPNAAYPPYNIEKTGEDTYNITLAVAGFREEDLTITSQENMLVVTGTVRREEGEQKRDYLYRGIAGRSFERRFQLADFVKVTSASLNHGLLSIDLAREVPEAMKPRQIKIATQSAAASIENKCKKVIDQNVAAI